MYFRLIPIILKLKVRKFINADFVGTISILNWTGSLQSANLHTPENAVLGQSSVLTCVLNTSLPVNTSLLSVQWMHRGNMVTTTSSGFVLKQGLSTSVYVTKLTLSETTVEQSGLYSCNVSLDTDRQQLTAEGNLTVSCKSAIFTKIYQLTCTYAKFYSFSCGCSH